MSREVQRLQFATLQRKEEGGRKGERSMDKNAQQHKHTKNNNTQMEHQGAHATKKERSRWPSPVLVNVSSPPWEHCSARTVFFLHLLFCCCCSVLFFIPHVFFFNKYIIQYKSSSFIVNKLTRREGSIKETISGNRYLPFISALGSTLLSLVRTPLLARADSESRIKEMKWCLLPLFLLMLLFHY
eukprot:gene2120-1296_t